MTYQSKISASAERIINEYISVKCRNLDLVKSAICEIDFFDHDVAKTILNKLLDVKSHVYNSRIIDVNALTNTKTCIFYFDNDKKEECYYHRGS